MKTGTLTLEATVTVPDDHDVEKYLEILRKSFANTFSCGVHDSYPDAHVRTEVTVR
jgi:hypothetical protein